ncbi:MAG: GtrA family protein [Clostridiales bacterium]|nr:GtrA family protein [Clostridiales bacterium]
MKKLINKGIEIYKKYKMPILYLVFGALTTLINILTYLLFYEIIKLGNVPSNIIAWIIAVIFAFATNKTYVFESKSKSILYELTTFLACRLGTGIIDLGIMFVTVDILIFDATLMKIISNVIVIILNFVFSKLIVFKKDR